MSLALTSRRAALMPGQWVHNELWRRARAVPSLDLRFADNKSLVNAVTGASLVTFTRASSATYVDSQGVIQTAATDVPRFDHNPTTGESLGLLVEEARTNLLLRSEEFDNASWTKLNLLAFGSGSTANAIAAPDGNVTADLITEDTSTNQHRVTRTTSGTTNSNVHTVSFFAKAATRDRVYVGMVESATFSRQGSATFNLSNGTITNTGAGANGATGGAATITAFPNGWYRCTYSLLLGGTDTAVFIDINIHNGTTINYTGNGTSGLYIWGAQLEAGAFPTSYIPTTTAAVTRSADVPSITGTAFSSWYRQDEGTMFANAKSNHFHAGINQFPRIVSISDGTTNNRIEFIFRVLSIYTDAGYTVVDSGVAQASFDTNRESNGTNLSMAYKVNDFAFAQGGSILSGATDNLGTVPTVDRISFGRRSGIDLPFNGTIRRFVFWPQRFPDSTLQAINQ